MSEKETDKKVKSPLALREEEILRFWQEKKIFEKTEEAGRGQKEFVFYEGPPTANGRPGIHHLEARAFKDIIPRYKTMRGYHVRRKGGWDTHGLPVELEVEKKLGLKSKKEIEQYGIARFNAECKESVWKYVDEWKQFTERMGYWIDLKNPYITYEPSYMESLWNVMKTVDEKKLLYKDYRIVPWCPRCGTALSSHELAQGYAEVKDISVYAKFELVDEPGTFVLAWTTTPWTLPGNVALAVGPKIKYVKVKIGNEFFILAKERLSILKDKAHEMVEEFDAGKIIGKSYKPLFNAFSDPKILNKENAWKIYGADFVTTTDGTGVVHIAPMYGADDFALATKVNLPKYHTVTPAGAFNADKNLPGNISGISISSEEDRKKGNIEILKYLQEKNLYFDKESHAHEYPFCWRCKTPLIYYARDSWYIKMSSLRDKLVKENEKINWEPDYIKEGRFGEWLREVKDWAISRERYWGTPLPVWECQKCKKREVIGSIEALKEKTSRKNKYFLVRHGEAESNLTGKVSCRPDDPYKLTDKGREQVETTAKALKKKKIDVIFVSDYIRTKETAEIIREALNISPDKVIIDARLREDNIGVYQGKTWKEYQDEYPYLERFVKTPEGGETLAEVRKRSGDFLFDIDSRFAGKNILIVSHDTPMTLILAVAQGWTKERILLGHERKTPEPFYFLPAELREISFSPYPHNDDYELDLHRPFIDEIKFPCDCGLPPGRAGGQGGEMKRVNEVMDVWFDSGAMPFAEDHYPFENKKWVEKEGFPADYISEAIDQTRGWFYTLHAVGVLMGFGKAYKNVICLGHILDKDGQKMSKSKGNTVNPWEMMDKYGADPLRFWMYGVNQPGESKNFDEKTVDEGVKKVFNLLLNVLSFYEMNSPQEFEVSKPGASENVLDRWIEAKFAELLATVETGLDAYRVFEPARAIRDFMADLSQWYLRRSRDRFKSDDVLDRTNAVQTTRTVLLQLAKLMAPFTPFVAEDVYRRLRGEKESVHMESWPKREKIDSKLLKEMEAVRNLVSLGLEARSKALIKVRQPLAKITVKAEKMSPELVGLMKDELNVKEVMFDAKLSSNVLLDIVITPALKEEGEYRELLRVIQDFRKEKKLQASDKISLFLTAPKEILAIVKKFETEIKKVCNVTGFETREGEFELKL
ncbi:MAG: class I tRNA ligase family protein [Candidatus Pacebacteria bacterium]|nr:class I tRNA ligase family protein [Candidatus Paceibacterota bacterium]MDD5356939.1 class I tRNA ligase family protein [Candidatus Paceibacterota bacterium]